ncbi:hypothetical protein LV84_01184 [Algoriphagus ratkowskyi]|uniref:Uncharacterized protein n=1 Tax=Algoriphagus ratkowskyi TaxID=57028 RepID=A0A2W7RE00_9BACT|nr:DUF6600 domain-containing protein [Algoriphagus ratkowskyi]PZX59158.1 hypothetical protein LV84_01184 [Algoriphagus ratkowskyi]TXD77558.1 hypothetical protein ESW18_12240 [Algoriphagus ratkowskyi]
MKTLQVPRWMRNLMMGIIALIWIMPAEAKANKPAGVSFQVFYDELMPYGDWVKDGRYGYVWLPSVYDDFHPYGTNGHWVMTGYGNTWVSDYDWGWATFHYGRWYYDDNYRSWAWIPDYNWGPAWVDWRSGGGYYGWAPMGPGFSINFRVNIPANYWVFVPQRRFGYANAYNYYVPYGRRVNIYNNTTIIHNTIVYNNNHYYGGPSQKEVERVTKRSYPERRVESSNSAGRTVASRNSVSAYRPDLQSANGTTIAARPSRTLSSGDARTQPAARPSSQTSRSEAVSGRSASTSAGTSRSQESSGASLSRSESSGVRSTSPTSNRGEFETAPYSGTQTRTSTPTRESQGDYTNSRSYETRTSAPTVRTESSRQPETRSTQTRTQSAPVMRSTENRTAPSTSTRTQPATSRTQSTSPTTWSTPSSQTRSIPATSRSTPQVGSSTSSRTAPASTSRTSSGTTRTSSSTSRGNN